MWTIKLLGFIIILIISCLAILGDAVVYTVTNAAENTPGGARFDSDIGAQYSQQTLDAATRFIFSIFQQSNPSERKNNIQGVGLYIDDIEGVAFAINDQIHVSARYIEGYPGDVKTEITGVLYHEMTHVWQWNGNRQAPSGLIEGMADFVRLKAGYAPSHWVSSGKGDRWDQGYDITARFLDYCNALRNGFVAELNEKMRDGYSDTFFEDLLGKPVDQIWIDYKARYNNQN